MQHWLLSFYNYLFISFYPFFTREGAQPQTLDLNPRSRFRSEFRAPTSFLKKQSQAGELQQMLRPNFPAQVWGCFTLRSYFCRVERCKRWWPWGFGVPPALQRSQVGWQGSKKCCSKSGEL